MQSNLAGQHVLVTGASGGVGTVLVEAFLAEGCRVTAQVFTNLSSLLPQLCDNLQVVACDVSSESSVAELFTLAAQFGDIHTLILNHGVFESRPVPVAQMTLNQWSSTLAINLTGSFLLARAFLSQIKRDALIAPKICIIGSTAGKYGEACHADYASTKSALQYGFTLSLKNEIVTHHARGRVNAVAPGWIDGDMAKASMLDPDINPLKKIASAQDVVNTVLFLCGDNAGHITGQCLMVEGGMEGRVLNTRQDLGLPST